MSSNKNSKQRINESNVETKFNISKRRKLHDFWALILYIICFTGFIAMTFYYSINKKEDKSNELLKIPIKLFLSTNDMIKYNIPYMKIYTKSINKFFIGDVIKLIIIPILLFTIILFLIYSCTGIFLHIVFILPILCSIIGSGFCFISGDILISLSLIISAFFSSIFYAIIFSRIKFVAKPFKMSVRIMWSCFSLFMGLIFIFTFLSLGISFAINTSLSRNFSAGEYSIQGLFSFFITTWTLFLISMISQSAMSAVTAQYLIHDLTGSFLIKTSFRIVLYSLGSACFASLMLAIVNTIQQLVSNEINNSDNKKDGNFVVLILLIILHTLLSFLEQFLQFLTSWAMTVIALKGCKLTTAMKSVLFDIKTGFISTIIAGKLICFIILIILIYFVAIMTLSTNVFTLKEISSFNNKIMKPSYYNNFKVMEYVEINGKKYMGVFNTLTLCYCISLMVFLISIGILLQKIIEMIYLIYTELPNVIKKKDKVVYKSIRKEEKFKSNCCC